jgi:uncharacterized protein with HEPN domain
MQKDDKIRLTHMLSAAREARAFVKNETRASIEKDRKLILALVKAVEIIGEAASKTSVECQKGLTQIPWRNIIGMRNRLIHAYLDVNLDILWKTITEDLSPLISELENILKSE